MDGLRGDTAVELLDAVDVVGLGAVETQGLIGLAAGNCNGSTPMPMRLERWMRSKLSVITALTPSMTVPLAAQSREEPVPYSLPASTTSGTSWSL